MSLLLLVSKEVRDTEKETDEEAAVLREEPAEDDARRLGLLKGLALGEGWRVSEGIWEDEGEALRGLRGVAVPEPWRELLLQALALPRCADCVGGALVEADGLNWGDSVAKAELSAEKVPAPAARLGVRFEEELTVGAAGEREALEDAEGGEEGEGAALRLAPEGSEALREAVAQGVGVGVGCLRLGEGDCVGATLVGVGLRLGSCGVGVCVGRGGTVGAGIAVSCAAREGVRVKSGDRVAEELGVEEAVRDGEAEALLQGVELGVGAGLRVDKKEGTSVEEAAALREALEQRVALPESEDEAREEEEPRGLLLARALPLTERESGAVEETEGEREGRALNRALEETEEEEEGRAVPVLLRVALGERRPLALALGELPGGREALPALLLLPPLPTVPVAQTALTEPLELRLGLGVGLWSAEGFALVLREGRCEAVAPALPLIAAEVEAEGTGRLAWGEGEEEGEKVGVAVASGGRDGSGGPETVWEGTQLPLAELEGTEAVMEGEGVGEGESAGEGEALGEREHRALKLALKLARALALTLGEGVLDKLASALPLVKGVYDSMEVVKGENDGRGVAEEVGQGCKEREGESEGAEERERDAVGVALGTSEGAGAWEGEVAPLKLVCAAAVSVGVAAADAEGSEDSVAGVALENIEGV